MHFACLGEGHGGILITLWGTEYKHPEVGGPINVLTPPASRTSTYKLPWHDQPTTACNLAHACSSMQNGTCSVLTAAALRTAFIFYQSVESQADCVWLDSHHPEAGLRPGLI